jgi:molecular chaperone DnaK
MKEHGDKLDEAERDAINSAVADLKKALETDDLADIQGKSESLQQASLKLGEKVYADAQGAEPESPMPGAGAEAPEASEGGDEKIIDADFEVKS